MVLDNVVRAGLTPKFKDVETLVKMLDYRCGDPSVLVPINTDQYTRLYRPDTNSCTEFEVEYTVLPSIVKEYSFKTVP